MGEQLSIDLGFADGHFEPGTHICQIYGEDKERDDALLAFVLAGMSCKEKTACFSEELDREALGKQLATGGISLSDAIAEGSLVLNGTSEVYFANDRFDPERMLRLITEFHESVVEGGYSAGRIIGEMTADIGRVEGGSRLMEYEARVSQLLREHPVTAVCQYSARNFDGGTIMDVLKVHPMMVVRGTVVHNPFFVPPEQFLEA